MTIAEKIKTQRKALGWTQTELGQRLGVRTNAVSKWECGRVEQIPTSKIKAMAALFGVQPSYLLDDEGPTPVAESGPSDPLSVRLNELLAHASEETKQAMLVLLEQSQKP